MLWRSYIVGLNPDCVSSVLLSFRLLPSNWLIIFLVVLINSLKVNGLNHGNLDAVSTIFSSHGVLL